MFGTVSIAGVSHIKTVMHEVSYDNSELKVVFARHVVEEEPFCSTSAPY